MNLREKYGEWGIILGATEGVGKAFAESDCIDAIFEACVEEAFENLGKNLSVIAGEHNKQNVQNWKANKTEDEYIRYMGSFYER